MEFGEWGRTGGSKVGEGAYLLPAAIRRVRRARRCARGRARRFVSLGFS